uniref:Putative secreted peptide n=1 Tax=Anopheles braziliensis TaxID=58242 RepID=A0A2M3ZNP1_9DIPT
MGYAVSTVLHRPKQICCALLRLLLHRCAPAPPHPTHYHPRHHPLRDVFACVFCAFCFCTASRPCLFWRISCGAYAFCVCVSYHHVCSDRSCWSEGFAARPPPFRCHPTRFGSLPE